MMVLKVKDKEYKVKFNYNCFCDTDLMDRTSDLLKVLNDAKAEDDSDVFGMGKVKELFSCIRDLLFAGFQKYNPVETVQEIGDIIDDYHDEGTEEERHGLMDLFTLLSKELLDEGFLGEVLNQGEEAEKVEKIPQDHKKAQRK